MIALAAAVLLPRLLRGAPPSFEEFVAAFNKTYSSPAEALYRRKVFEETREFVETENEKVLAAIEKLFERPAGSGGLDVQFGINAFSDVSFEEFRGERLMTNATIADEPEMVLEPETPSEAARLLQGEAPEGVDWSYELPALRNVLNQGKCGGCWAYAAAATVQGWISKLYGADVELAVLEPLMCAREANACKGGEMTQFAKYMAVHGLGLAQDSAHLREPLCPDRMPARRQLGGNGRPPFHGRRPWRLLQQNGERIWTADRRFIGVRSYGRVKPGMANLLRTLKRGPVGVIMFASKLLKSYKGGVYSGEDCDPQERFNHALTVVGYYFDEAEGYVLKVLNSWGPDWGDGGFFRMAAGPLEGFGRCLIAETKANFVPVFYRRG